MKNGRRYRGGQRGGRGAKIEQDCVPTGRAELPSQSLYNGEDECVGEACDSLCAPILYEFLVSEC